MGKGEKAEAPGRAICPEAAAKVRARNAETRRQLLHVGMGKVMQKKTLRSKIAGLGDVKIGCTERMGKSQNKPRFLAWVPGFQSGTEKRAFTSSCRYTYQRLPQT